MNIVWYVALGGSLGSAARYLLASAVQNRVEAGLPIGTLVVNITGSVLLGFLVRYALSAPAVSVEIRALITTGFCGGYTTFSTFSYETAALVESGDYGRASLYVGLSVALALVGTFIGFAAAREVLTFQNAG